MRAWTGRDGSHGRRICSAGDPAGRVGHLLHGQPDPVPGNPQPLAIASPPSGCCPCRQEHRPARLIPRDARVRPAPLAGSCGRLVQRAKGACSVRGVGGHRSLLVGDHLRMGFPGPGIISQERADAMGTGSQIGGTRGETCAVSLMSGPRLTTSRPALWRRKLGPGAFWRRLREHPYRQIPNVRDRLGEGRGWRPRRVAPRVTGFARCGPTPGTITGTGRTSQHTPASRRPRRRGPGALGPRGEVHRF